MRVRRAASALLIGLLLVQLCACRQKPAGEAFRHLEVAVQIECEGIRGLTFEYCLNRERVGGVAVSRNPQMDVSFEKGEKVHLRLDERDFPEPDGLEKHKFGLLLSASTEGGEEALVESLVEWNAGYGMEYGFVLSGSLEDGLVLEPETVGMDFEMTGLDELPEAFF